MFVRSCSICNDRIIYKNKYNYKRAELKNTNCKYCVGQLNGINNKQKKRSKETLERIKLNATIQNEKRKTGKNVTCYECGIVFYRSGWQLRKKERHFCSRQCADKGHAKLLLKHTLKKLKCLYCKTVFKQNKYTQKYCSTICSSKHNLKTINNKEPKKSKTRPELLFKELLEKNKIDHIFQKPVNWKRGWKKWYDFYIPKFNLLIEIDGTYWHGKNIETKDLNKQQWKTRVNDKFKNILAKKRGFKLLRIWSDQIDTINLKEILQCYE